jgi:hypothetical protein
MCVAAAFADSNPAVQKMGSMPLSFTENKGQWDEDVKFRADVGGAIVWICRDRVVYQFLRRVEDSGAVTVLDRQSRSGGNPASMQFDRMDKYNHKHDSTEQLVITARFVGANPDLQVVGKEMTEYKCNYFIGNDPETWYSDVPNFETVTLSGVYGGIDLHFFGGGDGKLSYSYDIAPGIAASQVALEYEGADQMIPDESGRMMIQTPWGEIAGILASPSVAEVQSAGEKLGSLDKRTEQEVEQIEQRQLNPQAVSLVYSTYLGGSGNEVGYGIAVDASGSAYVTGYTYSPVFPTQGAFVGSYNDSGDVFISKLSASGNSLVYSTYLGGTRADVAYGIAVDASGFGLCRWTDKLIQLPHTECL